VIDQNIRSIIKQAEDALSEDNPTKACFEGQSGGILVPLRFTTAEERRRWIHLPQGAERSSA
jgi:hypothetical protein